VSLTNSSPQETSLSTASPGGLALLSPSKTEHSGPRAVPP
jgi:hypothetical protein